MTTQEYDVETINRLYAVNAELLEALEAVKTGWESLDEGIYDVEVIEAWLFDDMKPAIDKARAAIAKAKP